MQELNKKFMLDLVMDPVTEQKIKSFSDLTPDELMSAIKASTRLENVIDPTLRSTGWMLNIYPTGNNLDLIFANSRYLFYHITHSEQRSYDDLKGAGISQFDQNNLSPEVAFAKIPVETRPLSTIPLIDQTPTDQTDLGTLEILRETGKFLHTIEERTNMLPENNSLDNLAFIPFKARDFVLLVPPFTLSKQVTMEMIVDKIKQGLEKQNGSPDKTPQLEAFLSGFKST